MIEWLLEANRALAAGDLAEAEGRYRKAVAADARNAIAMVGLARVALARGGTDEAAAHIRRALEIDPENAAARRHAGELARSGQAAERGATTSASGGPAGAVSDASDVSTGEPSGQTSADRRRSFLDLLLGRG